MTERIINKRKMHVEIPYVINVGGARVELSFVRPGGIEAITVLTTNLSERFFALKDYPGSETHWGVDTESLALAICIFVITGIHPTDRRDAEPCSWGSEGSRDRAIKMITGMLEDAWNANAK